MKKLINIAFLFLISYFCSYQSSAQSDCVNSVAIEDLNQLRGPCDNDLDATSEYFEIINTNLGIRRIEANNIPDHAVGNFPNADVSAQDKIYRIDLNPVEAAGFTPLLGDDGIQSRFGVLLNGVELDPVAAEPWPHEGITPDANWEWNYEALNIFIALDCNNAHVQPTGEYHYHGAPTSLIESLDISVDEMTLIGYAADGFPIYYKYAYSIADDATSPIIEMTPGYQLKSGERPGDGVSAPCGEYNGVYSADYEYVESLGTLDVANGRTGVTPEYPDGTYYYVVTEDYPTIPRYLRGTPSTDFGFENTTAVMDIPPVFTTESSIDLEEDTENYTLDIDATDGENDVADEGVTYSISGSDASFFEINEESGELALLITPDFESPVDTDADNIYELVIAANDGVNTTTLTLSVVITDVEETLNENLALYGTSSLSSTAWGGVASRAIDGNTDGIFSGGSMAHSDPDSDDQAYLEVDLGAEASIDYINVWNRTDCCSSRLSDYYIFISNNPFAGETVNSSIAQLGVVNYYQADEAGTPTVITTTGAVGRYVRIQLTSDENTLNLAELEVYGTYLASAAREANENVISTNSKLYIYPNPSSESITIHGADLSKSIEIYSLSGKKVLEATNTNTIDIRSLELGIYSLKYENQIIKFVKK